MSNPGKIFQLDFFEDTEISKLKSEVENLKDSQDRVRKKIFAENGKLVKTIMDLSARLEILEKNICKGIYHE